MLFLQFHNYKPLLGVCLDGKGKALSAAKYWSNTDF